MQRFFGQTWEERYLDDGSGGGEGGDYYDDSDDDDDLMDDDYFDSDDDDEDGAGGVEDGGGGNGGSGSGGNRRPKVAAAPAAAVAPAASTTGRRRATGLKRLGEAEGPRQAQMSSRDTGGRTAPAERHVARSILRPRHDPRDQENIAYCVPAPVVSHFLNDLKRHQGTYAGFPDPQLAWQPMQSAALRAHYGLGSGGLPRSGVLVCRSGWPALQPGDCITHVSGQAVGCDGRVVVARATEPLSFLHLLTSIQVGEVVQVTVVRGGVQKTLSIQVGRSSDAPVPPSRPSLLQQLPASHQLRHGGMRASFASPTYVVLGGLVLVDVCRGLLDAALGPLWPDGAFPRGLSRSRPRFRQLLPLLRAGLGLQLQLEDSPQQRQGAAAGVAIAGGAQTAVSSQRVAPPGDLAAEQLQRGEQAAVVLTDILLCSADDLDAREGLDNPGTPRLLLACNGEAVTSCRQLLAALAGSDEPYARLEFVDGAVLALDRGRLAQHTAAVQQEHQIRNMASSELSELFKAAVSR